MRQNVLASRAIHLGFFFEKSDNINHGPLQTTHIARLNDISFFQTHDVPFSYFINMKDAGHGLNGTGDARVDGIFIGQAHFNLALRRHNHQ